MSVLFIASLPRSSGLGIADLLYRTIDISDHPIIMTGHLHLAAALSGTNLSRYRSPLNLYDPREALISCLLKLNQIPVSPESYQSILQYYFSNTSMLQIGHFVDTLRQSNPFLIDPSFSHANDTKLFESLPDIGIEYKLLVIWRNPIDFSLDLMEGVYGLDCCLQLIKEKPSLSFPLDPLKIWLEFVNQYLDLIKGPSSVLGKIIQMPRELLDMDTVSTLLAQLALNYSCIMRPSSALTGTWMLGECPFSGDPSFNISSCTDSSLEVSLKQLSRFSSDKNIIHDVMEAAMSIGYIARA